jgi:precorrin-3B synthase
VSPALDACPGVLTLHPARDGLVARIRLPGGYASGARWRALARLSGEFGDGCVDVTARGNVQLRGLRAADAEALAAGAAEAGLMPSAQHDRARNITASPLSGLGGRPALRDLVDALDAALLAGPEFAALPGRFLFALDDGTAGASLASSDLGLCYAGPAPADPVSAGAASGGAASGGAGFSGPAPGGAALNGAALNGAAGGYFDLFVAGRRVGVRVPAAEAVAAVLAATRAALAAGVGASVTRIAALPDVGESLAAAVGGTLGAPAPPDTRLPLGPVPAAAATAPAPPASSAASPTRHTDPVGPSRNAPLAQSRTQRADLHDRGDFPPVFAGELPTIMEEPGGPGGAGQAGGVGGVVVAAARLGRLTGEQVEVIAGLVAPDEVVRVGVAGRLVIPLSAGPAFGAAAAGLALGVGLPAEETAAGLWLGVGLRADETAGGASGGSVALARLAAAGLSVAADDPMGDVTACSGAACDRSLADVRGAARPVSNYRKTHWAGCSRRCGCPPDAEPVVALDATRYRMPGEGAA